MTFAMPYNIDRKNQCKKAMLLGKGIKLLHKNNKGNWEWEKSFKKSNLKNHQSMTTFPIFSFRGNMLFRYSCCYSRVGFGEKILLSL